MSDVYLISFGNLFTEPLVGEPFTVEVRDGKVIATLHLPPINPKAVAMLRNVGLES